MKKVLALLLVLVMCLSLCACGGDKETKLSKDKLLANATELDCREFNSAFCENALRAEETYVGKNYLVTGYISKIESDHITIVGATVAGVNTLVKISVPLAKEDIMKLSMSQCVQIVGTLDSVVENTNFMYDGIMTNAFLVKDTFECSGWLEMYYDMLMTSSGKLTTRLGKEEAWRLGVTLKRPNMDSLSYGEHINYSLKDDITVTHVSGKGIETVQFGGHSLKRGTAITISGKLLYRCGNDGTWDIVDPKLISVGK